MAPIPWLSYKNDVIFERLRQSEHYFMCSMYTYCSVQCTVYTVHSIEFGITIINI